MGNMFSAAPWWDSKAKKTGYAPGPMQVPVVNRPAPALAQPAQPARPARPATPPPAQKPAPNRVPQGGKGDCPVCNRGFGKKFGR